MYPTVTNDRSRNGTHQPRNLTWFVGCLGTQHDLRPWRERGGIAVKDVNAAAEAGIPGWVRVTFVGGELYARGFGEGWGVRDGLWLLTLLELRDHAGDLFPRNVDFVLNPGDRAALPRSRYGGASHCDLSQLFQGGGGGSIFIKRRGTSHASFCFHVCAPQFLFFPSFSFSFALSLSILLSPPLSLLPFQMAGPRRREPRGAATAAGSQLRLPPDPPRRGRARPELLGLARVRSTTEPVVDSGSVCDVPVDGDVA